MKIDRHRLRRRVHDPRRKIWAARGSRPHCRGVIALPKATTAAAAQPKHERHHPTNWLESSISGLISMVLHMLVFLAVALLQPLTGGRGGAGEGDEVLSACCRPAT